MREDGQRVVYDIGERKVFACLVTGLRMATSPCHRGQIPLPYIALTVACDGCL